MAGQLRSLLIERTKPARPLLLEIAGTFDTPLTLFADPALKAEQTDILLLNMQGFFATNRQIFATQEETSIDSYLKRPVVRYEGAEYSASEVLSFAANQMGGSHFAPRWPKALSDLLLARTFGQSPLANVLVQVGMATQALGAALLKRLGDIEVELLVALPAQTLTANGYVWDARYRESTGRMFCYVDPLKRIHVGVVGLHGGEAQIISQELIDWSVPHLISFGLRAHDDLTSGLRLSVDGEVVAEGRSETFLFLHNAREHYTVFLNGTGESESMGLHVGLALIQMHGGDLSALERAEMLIERAKQARDLEQAYLVFNPDQHGAIEPGLEMPSVMDGVGLQSAKDLLGDFLVCHEDED